MSAISQIQKEIAHYEALELLPWKVRAGETRALVSLGLLFHKNGAMEAAEYFFSKGLEYKAWNSNVVYADFLYSKGDADNKKDAFHYYVNAFQRKEDNSAVRVAHYVLKDAPVVLQDESIRKGIVDRLYEVATNPKEESYHEALRLLKKLGAKEEVQKALEQRKGQFIERCKAIAKKFTLCKKHYAEMERFYLWFPGTWDNRMDKNIYWIIFLVIAAIIERYFEVAGAIASVFLLFGMIFFLTDKIRIMFHVLRIMKPKFTCGLDYNLNKRNTFYNNYTGQVLFCKPHRPNGKSYATYETKWEQKPTTLFPSGPDDYMWEGKTEMVDFDSDGYLRAWKEYKNHYTSFMYKCAEVRKNNMIEYCRKKPNGKSVDTFRNILRDIHGVYVDEYGVANSMPMSQFMATDLQRVLHAPGEWEREQQEMQQWFDISKKIKL